MPRNGRARFRLEAKKYLYDMQQAARLLTDFTSSKSFDDYQGDSMLKSAVERQFEIVGEALAKLAKLDQALAMRLTDHRRTAQPRRSSS
jgi:uncharacterized protein with HEPN domain